MLLQIGVEDRALTEITVTMETTFTEVAAAEPGIHDATQIVLHATMTACRRLINVSAYKSREVPRITQTLESSSQYSVYSTSSSRG